MRKHIYHYKEKINKGDQFSAYGEKKSIIFCMLKKKNWYFFRLPNNELVNGLWVTRELNYAFYGKLRCQTCRFI